MGNESLFAIFALVSLLCWQSMVIDKTRRERDRYRIAASRHEAESLRLSAHAFYAQAEIRALEDKLREAGK